ncbi:MAG: two-component sensor histidine kinase [Rhodobiaceae bacterium]|nr:two-component sensor histidine kinase [Rhodobiaceae bacterium]MCC0056351.1 two-component sensor histidine kinase [Rhodobiaceae bacterium]
MRRPLRSWQIGWHRGLKKLRSTRTVKFVSRVLSRHMPTGLYARSLIIIVTPVVLLQAVIAFVFMERHWDRVTGRLSAAVTQQIAAVIDVYETYPQDKEKQQLTRIAAERMGLTVSFLEPQPLPPAGPKPFFSLLDRTLSREITLQINRPFWIDTVGRSNLVEIRIQLKDAVLRVIAPRNAAYASNSHIFIVWMVGTSLVVLAVAVAFLRNQIKPIQRLALAAEEFGKGRSITQEFHPSGAREVRQASLAFIEMGRRIERQLEQRTTMLNGVSHDLRTILTRFKLQLALIGDNADTADLIGDVDEMQHMLEDYLSFARGDTGEMASETDIGALLESLRFDAERSGHHTEIHAPPDLTATVRANAIKRCLSNLVENACSFGDTIDITARIDGEMLVISVDDDGPGIPPESYEEVFRPFLRLDDARNQDRSGTGLGLSIARDIARTHGGDVELGESPAGGLRATLRVPV